MQDELEPERLKTFASQIQKSKRIWVDTQTLWQAFATAFPTFSQSPDRRRWFLAALERLDGQGLIQLPVPNGKRWDRTFETQVPTSVYLVRDKPEEVSASWKSFPWHPKLQWVFELSRLPPAQEEFLRRVHHGLVSGTFQQRAPLKYRSLQLTGQEKRLGELAETALFGTGRLSFEMLGCFPETLPLAYAELSDAPSVILFENAGSFTVARDVLSKLSNPPYGMIGYGGGNGIAKSLPYLTMIDRRVDQIMYVGDLDYFGMKIATRAARVATQVGLPQVEPATRLHQAMLNAAQEFGFPEGWPNKSTQRITEDRIADVAQFLAKEVRPKVLPILRCHHRIPEEVLGPAELIAVWH